MTTAERDTECEIEIVIVQTPFMVRAERGSAHQARKRGRFVGVTQTLLADVVSYMSALPVWVPAGIDLVDDPP